MHVVSIVRGEPQRGALGHTSTSSLLVLTETGEDAGISLHQVCRQNETPPAT